MNSIKNRSSPKKNPNVITDIVRYNAQRQIVDTCPISHKCITYCNSKSAYKPNTRKEPKLIFKSSAYLNFGGNKSYTPDILICICSLAALPSPINVRIITPIFPSSSDNPQLLFKKLRLSAFKTISKINAVVV